MGKFIVSFLLWLPMSLIIYSALPQSIRSPGMMYVLTFFGFWIWFAVFCLLCFVVSLLLTPERAP